MRAILKDRIIQVCENKLETRGPGVGLSFYTFFGNKNDEPELLMEVATWWIETHELDHFEPATKIMEMVKAIKHPNVGERA